MTKKLGIVEKDSVLDAIVSYRETKARIAELEAALKVPKQVLEAAAAETPDGVLATALGRVTLSIAQREIFDLKRAKVMLGEDALQEFIRVTEFTTLRVQ